MEHFIRENLASLSGGRILQFPLLVPERLDYYRFEIRKREGADKGRIRFSTRPSSWLLSFLVDEIILEYDIVAGRIVAYEGISDIKDAQCRNMLIRIDYL